MLLEVDACDRSPALRALLAEPVVHGVHVPVSLSPFAQLQRMRQVVADRSSKALDLLVREVRRRLERRQASPEQDLVGVSAPDACDRALVAKERMQLPALASEDLTEGGRVELERIRSEMCEIGVQLLLRDEPDACAFLLARLGEDELAAPAEPHAEHRRLRPLGAGLEVAQPAGAHEVDAEDEILALDGEQEVLPPSARALEASSVECGERRRERLQGRDVCGTGLLDRRARDERVELAHPRLDFGQLGHRS